ncbi:MAG: stage II sporulation protein R, partial [Ruminococcaceae bacterium]|nr:stage II sporulation protein R [Oscillospiraceae bacterium]
MAVWCCILSGALLLCGAVQCCLSWGLGAGQALQADTLRLHIRAASDCLADQTAKLAVRDAILAELDARCPA